MGGDANELQVPSAGSGQALRFAKDDSFGGIG